LFMILAAMRGLDPAVEGTLLYEAGGAATGTTLAPIVPVNAYPSP